MEDSAKLRLVKCPKCQKVLPELANYTVYQCGGCGSVLRGKLKSSEGVRLWETSDEGQGGGDQGRSESFLGKGVIDLSDNSDVDIGSNDGFSMEGQRRDLGKPNKGHGRFLDGSMDGDEKGVLENDFVSKDKRGKSIGRDQQEQKSHMVGDQFYGRVSNWPYGERGEMQGFRRKSQADMEGVRFPTHGYPDEGSSNSYSSFSYNYGEQWRNFKDMDGVNKVQHLEQDRADILRKLDELTSQLNKSSEVVGNPKEKVLPDGRMVPPDPFSGPETWFPEGYGSSSAMSRTSRPFFGPNKHLPGPPYFNYHHDPYPYAAGPEMAKRNFHPSMHNPNYAPGYGDPFVSPMMRDSHPLPHKFPQNPIHPYFPGRYADTGPDSYDPYTRSAMLHPPSCSCLRCYNNKRRESVPVPPAEFVNSRFPHTPASNDPMLYGHEIPGAVGPYVQNSRAAIPPTGLHERQPRTRWPRDYNSEMGRFVGSHTRKVVPLNSTRQCLPIAGASPFITCHSCFELLQLPKKTLVMVKNLKQKKIRCGACSSEMKLAVVNKKLVISPHSEMEEATRPTRVDDATGEVVNSRAFHSRGDVNTSAVNFSSDDYSGYDFHSVDRESSVLAEDSTLKSRERQSFHSSSPSISDDENIPEIMTAPGGFIHQPSKASPSPSPGSSFDDHVVNRLGKGNQSSRSDQELEKVEKNASRQNSLKEVVLATEMDVIDYSNTGVSQDSGDVSREHDHPRSNKRSDSFLANIIKKDNGKSNVTINGQPIPDRVIKKAEKFAGPIQPGNYWYDSQAGFWGVMGGPCLGIILPFIEEFQHPMPEKCAGGNTGVFVNGRELHHKDLELLCRRGLPRDDNRSYIVDISGRVRDENTGEELDSLGKLAPTVEKERRGFGMKVPRTAA